MIAAILPDIWPYLIGLMAIIGGALGWRRSIRQGMKRETALEAAEAYAKTRKDMDDAAITSDDPAVLREWLRSRDPGQR